MASSDICCVLPGTARRLPAVHGLHGRKVPLGLHDEAAGPRTEAVRQEGQRRDIPAD